MKKYFLAILMVVALVGAAYSAAPAVSATNGNYIWQLAQTISADAAFDTLKGAATPADSVMMAENFVPRVGWEHILVTDTTSGGSTDSSTASVIIKCKDAAGNALYEVAADTLGVTAVGEAVLLPFGSTAIGHKFNVILRAVAATDRGTGFIVNRAYIYRRKVVVAQERSW